jgi:hypothetical protein
MELKSEAAMYQVAVEGSLGVQKYARNISIFRSWLLLGVILYVSLNRLRKSLTLFRFGVDSASRMKQHYTL